MVKQAWPCEISTATQYESHTRKGVQHLIVSLPTAKHDGTLCNHSWNGFLGLLQNREALFVPSTGVTHQPGTDITMLIVLTTAALNRAPLQIFHCFDVVSVNV